jgi:glycosyltransferase involved in cell wall biosynthesis
LFSILVPVYNQPVEGLARQLIAATESLPSPCEIIFAEDGSTQYLDQNAALASMQGIRYVAFAKNAGRSAIRNRLAGMARGTHFIFLDCDVALPDGQLLARYARHDEYDVVCGGHIYHWQSNPACSLHYRYGTKRECPDLFTRQEAPYRSFKTSNFLVKKEVFDKIKFDESLSTYGHEDTLFGYALKQASIKLLHIDNPVVHLALESNEVFLNKTREALHNALTLVKQGKIPPSEIRAIEAYYRLKENAGGRALLGWLQRSEDFLLAKVKEPKPRMRSFDFLKLAWLRQLDKG